MAVIRSKFNPRSEVAQANRAAMQAKLSDIEPAIALAEAGGGEAGRARDVKRGKLRPRERTARLLDHGSPFLEIGMTAAHGLYDGASPSAGIVTGIGRVEGREVMIVANDATAKGGTYYPM